MTFKEKSLYMSTDEFLWYLYIKTGYYAYVGALPGGSQRQANLKILFFEEGSPYSMYGYGIIDGKENKKSVKEVFDFFYNTLIDEDKELFVPEQIYKDKTFTIENYPQNIPYSDMKNNTNEEKTRLLEKWKY